MRVRLAFCLLASLAIAQTPDTASIHGTVQDQSHAPIAGVRIAVRNSQTALERTAQTDTSGAYSLSGLPVAGKYEITGSKQGFADAHLADVALAGGSTAEIDMQMNVAAGKAEITVTGVVGEVRTDAPQLGTLLESQQIDQTPLLSRRISNLPMLNAANRPAINQGDVFMNQTLFTTNGAGRRQAWFETDGVTNSDSWGRQTLFSTLPVTAVEEMNVLANAFSAEFGATTGAVVNIVTKTGGSKLHGDVLELWRPAETSAALSGFTSANATSGNQLTSDSLGQSAVSLGGPLGKATHFFAAGEYSREDKASPVTSPIAPGYFVGHYRGWLGFVRLDHQINDRNTLFFRGNLDGFHDTNPNGAVGGNNLPTVDRVFRRRTYSTEIGETAVLSPSLLNNVRVQFQLASPITEFDPVIYGTQYVVPISTGGTFTTGTSQSALLLNRQYQISDTLSASRGRHQMRFGFDVIHAHNGGDSKEFGGPIYLGQFTYNTCTQALSFCEGQAYIGNIANVRTYTQSYGNAHYTVGDTLWSLFLQDDIHVRRDFTLNLGLRYEQQTFTDSRYSFAPRAGFSYNVAGDGKTVLRGGFGIYCSQIVDNSAANWALTGPTGVFNYSATPGQVGFPVSVSAAPLPAFPAGAPVPLRTLYVRPGDNANLNQYFPTSTLIGYQSALLNPRSNQWTFGIERRLPMNWVLSVDYVGSHTTRINRPRDVDPPTPFIRTQPGQVRTAQAANCTRPYWIAWYAQQGMICNPNTATNPQPPYSVITSDVNDGYSNYAALDVNLKHTFSRKLSVLVSYTWSHALDNVDPDVPGQNPNDPNFTGRVEYGNAVFDQRHRFVMSGVYVLPGGIHLGGVFTLATGLPYNITTGVNNSGDTGATTDRPVINGVVVGRNTGRGTSIYDIAPFVERPFSFFGEKVRFTPRVEAFNVFNHPNFVGFSGTWGNAATAGPGFGTPLTGITNQLPARSLQFTARVSF
ncbi:MAG TPA: carboxypeptidase regulatory-like domain-containing protein [Candidatus Acidoferrales bacterium]|nr:carboxypeptidase regulatory-like domain-containing protein [Candidatus Acidoferrales bacterium]